jgi:general secretion pathway protein A
MEEVRLLANLETLTDKLLPVVMAGQPELADMLDRPELRHLKQRVALRADLAPLGVRQVAAYVAGRIRKAGGDPVNVFTKEAVVLIHNRSRGIPRTISVVCDNAMLSGYSAGVKPIGPDIIEEVSQDFRLRGAGGAKDSGNNGSRRPSHDGSDNPSHWGAGRHDAESGHPVPAHTAREARR